MYNGKEQSPVWNDYDPEQLTISGDVSGVNAGTYTVAFTPKSNTEWPDGTTAAKTVKWTIGKANGELTLSSIKGTLRYVNDTATFTINTNGSDGPISVSCNNTTKAKVSMSGNTVTVTPTGTGNAMVTVRLMESLNHTGAEAFYNVTTQGYLIYNGKPCSKVIGVGKNPQSGYDQAAPNVWVSQKDGEYQVYTSNSGYGMAYLDTKVDLTNYSKMTINGTLTQSNPAYNGLRAWTSIGTYIGSNMVSEVQWADGATSASKDISGVDKTAYIGLGLKETVQKITSIRLT